MKLNVYLFFDGECAEAFDRYRSIFGGEFATCLTFADGPPDMAYPPEHAHRIMHVSLPVGDSMLMGSDVAGQPLTVGSSVSVSCHPETVEEGDRIHAALADGGRITFPIQKTFWGSYFGLCTDRFGVDWQVNVALDG